MICGHMFQQGITCNRDISYVMGFKLGMCPSCYVLVGEKRRVRLNREEVEDIEARRVAKERAVYEKKREDARLKRREKEKEKEEEAQADWDEREVYGCEIHGTNPFESGYYCSGCEEEDDEEEEEEEEEEREESEKKRVNVAIRHRLSKLGVRY